MNDLHYLSLVEASRLIESEQLSSTELVEAHLARIRETDGLLNSFITLLSDESLSQARNASSQIRSGKHEGVLHGIPVGLKDLYYTKNVRTTIGSKITADFVPDYDAAVTEKFNKAGAILLGKLQMHEFALGVTSENPHYGPAHNPWDIDCITGGSSGGSGSSVASGQCMAALGSDTGGSIRIPAPFCGIVGLKPTFGRVSRYGVYPLSWSFDTVGPMARTVEDTALVLNAISGHDHRDNSSINCLDQDFTSQVGLEIKGLRIGIHRDYFFEVGDPEVMDAVEVATTVLEGLGAVLTDVSVPMMPECAFGLTILASEGAEVHLENLRNNAGLMDPYVRTRLLSGLMITAPDYIRAQRARTLFNNQVAEIFEQVDLILTPTTPIPAVGIGHAMDLFGETGESGYNLLSRNTRPFNLTGSPAISVPCGFTRMGLPIGLQLTGRLFDEATVFRAAHAYEQATDWHMIRPTI